jgi:hypothetical protein
MVMAVNLEHKLNATSPIDVTFAPMVTAVRAIHLSNALLPIDVTVYDTLSVTESGMVKEVTLRGQKKSETVESLIWYTSPFDPLKKVVFPELMVTAVRAEQL